MGWRWGAVGMGTGTGLAGWGEDGFHPRAGL